MRVMPDIQQQRDPLALPFEFTAVQTAGHARVKQRLADLPLIPRQPHQQVGLDCQSGVFHRQVEQRQVAQHHLGTLRRGAAPVPDTFGTGKVEVATTQEQRYRQFMSLVQQRLGRVQVAAQRRFALAEDAGLFERDQLAGIAR